MKARRRGTWTAIGLGLAGSALFATLTIGIYSSSELARFRRAQSRRDVIIYSSGQVLAPSVSVRAVDLAGTLARLGYVETRAEPRAPGQFRRSDAAWDVVLREDRARIHLDLAEDRIARVLREGRDVHAAALEGEVLAGRGEEPGEEYRPIRLAEAPRVLVDAVLAIEDRRFFQHGALDPRGLARAAWANLRARKVAEGGSTLTQQLVKSRLLSPERTLMRKLREAWLASLVEWRYSKSEILEAYLNEVYLGQRGALAIRGVGAAARAYFAKEVHQLTPGEAALLAGMMRAPNTYSPAVDPDRARERRDIVLARMRDLGMLDSASCERARREPLRGLAGPRAGQSAPYFADHVRGEVEQRFGQGTRIVTTLDLSLQRFAENAVASGLDQLESRWPRLRRHDPRARLQAALVAIDPVTGEIRAFVGGRDYQSSQFDRVALARRQPGSAFKPFVYLTALRPHHGYQPLTAATIVDDTPVTIMVDGRPWSPRNYENRYEGPVSVRRALEQSLNAATVRVAQRVGSPAIVDTARALGLGEKMTTVPAVALGAFEVTPLDLARAYAPFATGGLLPGSIRSVRSVYQSDGAAIATAQTPPNVSVLSAPEAFLMTSLLEGVIRSGTARSAQGLGVHGSVAGKTGTTNDGRDAWFAGYSSRLVAVVWVGFDNGEPHGLSGAAAALPIWARFMKQALDAYPAPDFAVPDGITTADIDPTNGKLAGDACPLVVRETFLRGTEPEPCDEHRDVAQRMKDWWHQLRDWIQR